ncbi:DUF6531 domain-containing protein, partial [Litorivivens sp.]|uniref:DUF6531 domain-containing protein n=1 Tax=Litorivivens sp. TaxID=2020868 RepID=UPI00356509EC
MYQRIFACLRSAPVAGLAVFLFSQTVPAHQVTPMQLDLYPGQTRQVSVKDAGTCKAFVQGRVLDTKIATVEGYTPADAEGVEVLISVKAADQGGGETTMEVTWVGENAPSGSNPNAELPCQEDNREFPEIVKIIIKDPKSKKISSSGTSLDPVNTFSGEFFFQEVDDFYLGGPLPLYFNRYYGSQLLKGDITGDTGNNWLHNFEWRLHRAGNIVVVISPRAEVYQFSTDGKGNWSQQGGNGQRPLQLIENGSDFVVFNGYEQLSYLFNSEG